LVGDAQDLDRDTLSSRSHAGPILDDAVQHVIGCEGHFSTFIDVDQSRRAPNRPRPLRAPRATSEIHRGVIARSAMKKGAGMFDLHR